MLQRIARPAIVPACVYHDEDTGQLQREHTQEEEKENSSASRDSPRCAVVHDLRRFEHSIQLEIYQHVQGRY